AYLRLLLNPKDRVSLERVINVPPRGIGPKGIKEVLAHEDSPDQWPIKAQGFLRLMAPLRAEMERTTNVSELIEKVVDAVGFKAFLQDGTLEGEGRWENVQELISAASGRDSLEQFLEEVALMEDQDERAAAKSRREGGGFTSLEGQLTLMTLHAAKGLEFPVVFMVGMEEGILPHSRALTDQEQLEEERRLTYVGMTRAMRRLYLIYAYERRLFGLMQNNAPSRFLLEIPGHLIEKI
ncbi:MAG: 3'-5' exonuclease, partial [Methanothrix sp.]